jgi:hypothetical protein
VCEDGEAGAGEEVAHQHGGPADLAGGGAAGPGARGHAAAQPPATPGDPSHLAASSSAVVGRREDSPRL